MPVLVTDYDDKIFAGIGFAGVLLSQGGLVPSFVSVPVSIGDMLAYVPSWLHQACRYHLQHYWQY